MIAAWKVAPALAVGNSVVLKPAQQSPLSATLLAQLFVEAGGPPGVFNVVHGTGESAGKPLALHMDVDKISFTGSSTVGKLMPTNKIEKTSGRHAFSAHPVSLNAIPEIRQNRTYKPGVAGSKPAPPTNKIKHFWPMTPISPGFETHI
jgi:delta 1-pyrroline-5-carboxylate dehydrogenase